jgi:peptide/nickel transport system permease protein
VARFLARRVILTIPVLLGVATLVFSLIHLIPGDPAQAMLGEAASPQDIADLRQRLGLDRPLIEQYGVFLKGAVKGDLGISLRTSQPVTTMIAERMPATFELALAAMAFAILLAMPLGMAALGAALAAILARMTRATLLEELREQYVQAARARGASRLRAVVRHAFRNSLIPIVTLIGLQFGAVLTGAVITETIFAWPGIGRLLIQSIGFRDYPIVQGCILLIAVTYVGVNLVTDLVYGTLDPRIRYE